MSRFWIFKCLLSLGLSFRLFFLNLLLNPLMKLGRFWLSTLISRLLRSLSHDILMNLSPIMQQCMKWNFHRVWISPRKNGLLTLITFNSAVELGDAWGNLQALHEDALLTLDSDVLGPSNEAGEVSLRLDVSSDSKVAWVLFEQRIFSGRVGSCTLSWNEDSPFGLLLNLHIWTKSSISML